MIKERTKHGSKVLLIKRVQRAEGGTQHFGEEAVMSRMKFELVYYSSVEILQCPKVMMIT